MKKLLACAAGLLIVTAQDEQANKGSSIAGSQTIRIGAIFFFVLIQDTPDTFGSII